MDQVLIPVKYKIRTTLIFTNIDVIELDLIICISKFVSVGAPVAREVESFFHVFYVFMCRVALAFGGISNHIENDFLNILRKWFFKYTESGA